MKDIENPLISVVVPVYNVEPYLLQSIRSIQKQDYENIEIVLVDDGSTDNSGFLCDQLSKQDKRIIVIHKRNGGLSDARNVGIKESNGKYITLVDSDDLVDSDYVSYLYSLIKHTDCPMSLCAHRIFYTASNRIVELGDGTVQKMDARTCIKKMCYHDQVDTTACAKLYHRNLFEHIQYPVGKKFEDIGTTYRLFLESKVISCGFSPKYTYQIRKDSITTGTFDKSKLNLLEMTDRMADDVLKIYPDLKNAVLRRQVYARLSTINQTFNIDNSSIPLRNEMIKFVKDHGQQILHDKQAPLRDKVAISLLKIGFPVYHFGWNLYCYLKK